MVLSGADLPSLGGRPLPGLAALSFSVCGFCLATFFSSFAASSRTAAKSTTLPEYAGAESSLQGGSSCSCSVSALGTSGAAGPGGSGTVGSAFSVRAAFSAGAGSATTGSALPGAGGSGAGACRSFLPRDRYSFYRLTF